MTLVDLNTLAGLGLPIGDEERVDRLIEFARGIVADVEEGDLLC